MKLRFVIDEEYDESLIASDRENVLEYAKVIYGNSFSYLEKTRDLYQSSWDEIGDQFSKYVEAETGFAWFYESYECVISVVHQGISNWGELPKIVRGWKENPYSMRRITAHELIISHYFEIYRRHYSSEGITDGQVWALAEIAAFALTSLTEEVKKYWPWDTEYSFNHNYPHIVSLQRELGELFSTKKNFEEFVRKGIELVRKYPNMTPSGELLTITR